MSIDRSLRLKSSLVRHRNVLTRAERVAYLMEHDRWDRESPIGLPKIANRKAKAAAKKKAEKVEGEAAVAAPEAAPAK